MRARSDAAAASDNTPRSPTEEDLQLAVVVGENKTDRQGKRCRQMNTVIFPTICGQAVGLGQRLRDVGASLWEASHIIGRMPANPETLPPMSFAAIPLRGGQNRSQNAQPFPHLYAQVPQMQARMEQFPLLSAAAAAATQAAQAAQAAQASATGPVPNSAGGERNGERRGGNTAAPNASDHANSRAEVMNLLQTLVQSANQMVSPLLVCLSAHLS